MADAVRATSSLILLSVPPITSVGAEICASFFSLILYSARARHSLAMVSAEPL